MAEEKFKLRLDLKTGNEEVDLYLYDLHSYVMSFETSSIKQLIISLDNLAQKICDDIDIIAGDSEQSLSILSTNKDDKIFDRVLMLISKIKDFRTISEMAESLRPEVSNKKTSSGSKKMVDIPMDEDPLEAIQKTFLNKKK